MQVKVTELRVGLFYNDNKSICCFNSAGSNEKTIGSAVGPLKCQMFFKILAPAKKAIDMSYYLNYDQIVQFGMNNLQEEEFDKSISDKSVG